MRLKGKVIGESEDVVRSLLCRKRFGLLVVCFCVRRFVANARRLFRPCRQSNVTGVGLWGCGGGEGGGNAISNLK